MRKALRFVLGVSLVWVIAQAVQRNSSKKIDEIRNSNAIFWYRLSGVLKDYLALNALMISRETISDEEEWEDIAKDLSRLRTNLLAGFADTAGLYPDWVNSRCELPYFEAFKATTELEDLVRTRQRRGMREISVRITNALNRLSEVGEAWGSPW